MAHFAKISEDNIVLQVLVVNDQDVLDENNNETESVGQKYLETHNNWPAHLWIQTSYNTRANQHRQGGTPFRGNYASLGGIYDPDNDVFYLPQPYPSWTISVDTGWVWKAPVDMPDDGKQYDWNEENTSWEEVE